MQVKNSEGAIEYEDPRLSAFFEKNKAGEYVGGISGTNYPKSTSKLQDWCRPVATFDMPVYLITVSEIEFFKAEYYVPRLIMRPQSRHRLLLPMWMGQLIT